MTTPIVTDAAERRRTVAVATTGTVLALVAYTTPIGTLAATASALGAGPSGQAWILSSMSCGLAVALLPAGAIGDDHGRRRMFVAGALVLIRRRVNWNTLVAGNIWLFVFFLYWVVSVAWSDYPFVGLKRWIKDMGNLIMVLVILTEADPIQTVKTVFTRCAFVLLPLSVLFIKYYPDLGRYYSRWTWEPVYCGVTTEKNALGCLVLVCGLFLGAFAMTLRLLVDAFRAWAARGKASRELPPHQPLPQPGPIGSTRRPSSLANWIAPNCTPLMKMPPWPPHATRSPTRNGSSGLAPTPTHCSMRATMR